MVNHNSSEGIEYKVQHIEVEKSTGYKHKISYVKWYSKDYINGNENDKEVEYCFCVHRLGGNGRDYDELAKRLVKDNEKRVVICPDMPGRGLSDFLKDPMQYTYTTYCSDLIELIEHTTHSKTSKFNYIGTSMGGMIAFFLASLSPFKYRFNRLIINDIGPYLNLESLMYIKSYIGSDPKFATRELAFDFFKKTYVGFGKLTDDEIHYFIEHYIKWDTDSNCFVLHFDPKISVPFNLIDKDVDIREMFKLVEVDTLVLRGKLSQILPVNIYQHMLESKSSKVIGIEFEEVGHAPALLRDDQIQPCLDFLNISCKL